MFIRKNELVQRKMYIPLKTGDTAMLMEPSYASDALGLRLGTVYLITAVRKSQFTGEEMVTVKGMDHERWIRGETFN